MSRPGLSTRAGTSNVTAVSGSDELAREAALVLRLRAGDDDAFAELVATTMPRLLATARRMLADDELARDAVQESFLSAFKAIAAFGGQSRLYTWLHRILVNTVLMRLRWQRSRPERSIDELLPQFQDDGHHLTPPAPWRDDAVAQAMSKERAQLVRDAIDELPDTFREVLLLRDLEELSTEETAAILGVTENAVKIRLHRARQALRALLDRHFRSES